MGSTGAGGYENLLAVTVKFLILFPGLVYCIVTVNLNELFLWQKKS